MIRTVFRRSGRLPVAALVLAGGLIVSASAAASDQGRVSSPIDVDTGLRCLTQFCDYVRARRDRDCLCKKNVITSGNLRKITLDCKIFNTQTTCEP